MVASFVHNILYVIVLVGFSRNFFSPCEKSKKKNRKYFRLTVTGHAQSQTLLEPAVLTPVPVDAVYHAVLVARTLVVDHGRLRPPEESLAAFTRDYTVVDTTGLVTAHLARYDLDLSCRQKRTVEVSRLFADSYFNIITKFANNISSNEKIKSNQNQNIIRFIELIYSGGLFFFFCFHRKCRFL